MSDVAERPRAARAASPQPTRSGATVTVGCKLPNGLVLEICEKRPVQEQMFGGGTRMVDQWFKLPEKYRLHGSAVTVDQMLAGEFPAPIIGGFALTSGIPLDFWEKWVEQYGHMDLVKSGLVFAHESEDHVRGYARENSKLRTGLEAIDPDNPAAADPEFRRVRKGKIREDDEEAGM